MQQIKTDFPEVVVVEASAGSGKTFALAKRYLKLLYLPYLALEDIPSRSILAITFTNKATVEMKERILELLKKISLNIFVNEEEEKDILGTLEVDKSFAQAKATRIMDAFIRNYNFFGVQTIDSFINALLLGCALNIERSAHFKIKRDYAAQLSYCLDLAIEEALTNKEVLTFLEQFLEHYLFVENRSGWFPKDDILELIHSLFMLSNKYGHVFSTLPSEAKDIIKNKKLIFHQIQKLAKHFPEGFNVAIQKSIQSFLEKSKDIFDISNLPTAFQSTDVPMNRDKVATAEFKKEWRIIAKELVSLVEADAACAYNPYIKLFQRIVGLFQLASKKDDVLFLEELNLKARLLFDEGGVTLAEIYYRLASRFKHYLIDEFQDTSVLQWHNLEEMIKEALASGGSLFYVGDKKQAIYRFRGGEAKLFDEVRDIFSYFNVRRSYLLKNWRSQKSIVEFNNRVFSQENLLNVLNRSKMSEELEEDSTAISEIVAIFKDAIQNFQVQKSYGYVRVERLKEKDRQDRNRIIQPRLISLIEELHHRFRYKDIALLARDNDEVELLSSWLLSVSIPVESEKTLNVIENPLIKDIISLLIFLNSPIDDLSFASFILGDIFSAATGIANDEITTFIFNLNREKELKPHETLYRLFRKRYPGIWQEYFEELFKNVGFILPYELVTSIYAHFEVLERFKDHQAFFMRFLELVKQKEDEYVGLGDFLEYLKNAPLEDLYVTVAHSDSVKVLTIHKSKGLEFPVVIIPFLHLKINPESGGKGTSSYVVKNPDRSLGLLRITKTHRLYSKRLQRVYIEAYKRSCIDELNTLYVALTRPQYELYIFIPRKSGTTNNKAAFLIPSAVTELGSKRIYPELRRDAPPSIMELPPLQYKDWIAALRDEFLDAAAVRRRERIIEGNVLHTILSCVTNCLKQDKEEVLESALGVAQHTYPFIKDFSSYRERVQKLLDKRELEGIFYVQDGEVFCEKEVVNNFGDTKRIDRLIIKGKEVWIVDYKSSQEGKEEYAKQIQEYKGLIKAIYPAHMVRGFLVYLDEMVMEKIKD